MIEIKNLGFSYEKKPFIKGLNLAFSDSSFTAVIGENGSGKTTLLKLIMGELKAECGNIIIDKTDTSSLKRPDIAKMLSYFPQGRPTPDISALEVVTLGRYPYTRGKFITPEEDKSIAASAMNEYGILHLAERNMKTLSFGERQKVYFAMQRAQDTNNCLFDEPTNFIDAVSKFAMLKYLHKMSDEGRCVVAVIHDIALALSFADRIVTMKNGAVTLDGAPDKLYNSGELATLFGVRIKRIADGGKFYYSVLPE